MKKNLIWLLIIALVVSCNNNNNSNDSSYLNAESNKVIKVFFNQLENGKYSVALKDLLAQNQNIDVQDSLTKDLMIKFDALNKSSGKYVSARLLRKKELGNDLGVYSYFVKYKAKFYRFVFTFYNNGSQVKIYKFSFDDSVDIEIEDLLKLYVN